MQEMAPNARFWRTYNDESAVSDAEVMDEQAGLFSAVVTTFVVQASESLKPDFAQISPLFIVELIAVQRATAKGTPVDDVPMMEAFNTFSPDNLDVWTHNLWFTSLLLSLITALVAVLAKQWMHHYDVSSTSGSARERARLRQFRYTALRKWQVPMIIGCFPVLLHLSLAIFLIGLILSLLSLQLRILYIVASISGIVYLFYAVSSLLPIAYPQCPYKTPLSYILCQLADRL
ncbi:hypothetical protein ARMGADRAFT_1102628 [Armillaria gallica]|uniref:DUF6535 domain-containing protein n=1 Tax=Armillaria gallica TaxID=47427 RepID=A0A2H3DZZ7_ARMGA|nr:hypothetical protein ARMGADRAFT_1102628 [Armillaria gallica]